MCLIARMPTKDLFCHRLTSLHPSIFPPSSLLSMSQWQTAAAVKWPLCDSCIVSRPDQTRPRPEGKCRLWIPLPRLWDSERLRPPFSSFSTLLLNSQLTPWSFFPLLLRWKERAGSCKKKKKKKKWCFFNLANECFTMERGSTECQAWPRSVLIFKFPSR